MSCERALSFLETTIGDTLDPAEVGVADAAAMRSHVASCADCTALRDEIRGGATFAARLYATDAAGDAALAAAVDGKLRSGRVLRIRRLNWAIGVAAAVLVSAVAIEYSMVRNAARSGRGGGSTVAAANAPGLVPGYAGPHFVDVTDDSGITSVDHTGDKFTKDWMVETVGHGAAAFDMDGDGDLDLFVPDGNVLDPAKRVRDGWRLWRNDGAMRFTDVTKGSGLECDAWAGAAVAGDVTGDGLPDLYVPCFGENHLFANRGGGRFEDVTKAAGVAGLEAEWSTAACMADFDGDGSIDIFVSNYADMRRFMAEASGPKGCKWRDMAVACGPQPLMPQQSRLFLGKGDGTFTDATASNLPKFHRYAFQCVALDFNGDGAPDVFVAADGHPNVLLLNDGHGHFTEEAMAAGVATDAHGRQQACMGVAAGDVDGDGLTDLFITNFSHEPNVLYRALNAHRIPTFSDVTAPAGLVENERLLGWGASLFDFDLDGSLDLMFANGHLYPGVEDVVPTTSYAQPMTLLHNDGAGRFSEITGSASASLVEERVHRGLVVADFDDDGLPDAFLTVLNGRSILLRHDGAGAGRSIRLALLRKDGRTPAPGAHVVVTVRAAGGERTIARDVVIGSSFASSEDPRLLIGIGAAERVESVEVRWPMGATQRFGALAAGRLYELTEGRPDARVLR